MYAYMRDLSDLRSSIDLDVGSSQPVPALLQLPCIDRRVPAVLLVHGLTSRKEDMADSIGRALVRRDIASLAIDLPLHGARSRGAARKRRTDAAAARHLVTKEARGFAAGRASVKEA